LVPESSAFSALIGTSNDTQKVDSSDFCTVLLDPTLTMNEIQHRSEFDEAFSD